MVLFVVLDTRCSDLNCRANNLPENFVHTNYIFFFLLLRTQLSDPQVRVKLSDPAIVGMGKNYTDVRREILNVLSACSIWLVRRIGASQQLACHVVNSQGTVGILTPRRAGTPVGSSGPRVLVSSAVSMIYLASQVQQQIGSTPRLGERSCCRYNNSVSRFCEHARHIAYMRVHCGSFTLKATAEKKLFFYSFVYEFK